MITDISKVNSVEELPSPYKSGETGEEMHEVEGNVLTTMERAVQITERIKANGKIAVNAVCSIGKDLRTMKVEKLYSELGYSDFEDYAEKEFQLKRRQAYQYISVFEKLGEDFVQSNAQLGITKLALLAAANPEDRAEVMETENVQQLTAKELEDLLNKCKEQGEQLSFLQDQNAGLIKENEELQEKLENAPVVEVEKEIIREIPDTNAEKELAAAKKAQKASEKELKEVKKEAEEFKKAAEEAKEKARKEKVELEARIAELQKVADKSAESIDKSSFKALLANAYKEITGLVEFIKTSSPADREIFIKKAYQILNAGKDALGQIDPCIGVEEDEEEEEDDE